MSSAENRRFAVLGSVTGRALLGRLCAAALLLAVTGAGAWAQSHPGDPQHGETVARDVCSSCHGPHGNDGGAQDPKLAGQKQAYLYDQLMAFKSGKRKSDTMLGVVETTSDADLADAAAYFARQRPHADAVHDADLAKRGERIFYLGLRGLHAVPPCSMCHSESGRQSTAMRGMMGHGGMMGMMGNTADAPRLAGQHAAYVLDRLGYFATKEGTSTSMGRIALVLPEADRKAVAAYISGMN